MPKFTIVIQRPKPKKIGIGCLSVGKNGDADFFEGSADKDSKILASMTRVKIDWAAANGIFISGMESNGFDRHGEQKFSYQEWFLCYLDGKT